MREDVVVEKDGVRCVDFYKAIGKGYERGWFTNFKGRYRFYKGARSTKKSYDMLGYEPIMKILSDPRRNILICRQNDVDNRQSTFERLCGCIADLGLESYFKMTKNPLEITYTSTGQKIVFRGLNNPTSLNSITFAVGYLTDVYIEEAFEVQSFEDFRKLDGSLRGKLPDDLFLQITCCFNAWSQEHWLYHEFFKDRLEDDDEALENNGKGYIDYRDENYIGYYGRGIYLHISSYKINEFRDKEVYDVSMEEMRKKAYEIYRVEGLGCWGNATAQTYPEFNSGCYIPAKEIFSTTDGRCAGGFVDFAIGIDTGFSNGEGKKQTIGKNEDVEKRIKSATTMTLVGITRGYDKCIIVDEYFHSNDRAYNRVNTDNQDQLTSVQFSRILVNKIVEWIGKYTGANVYQNSFSLSNPQQNNNLGALMKGRIVCYVDSADKGFREMLEADARSIGLYNVEFVGSTKISIQNRVDYIRYLMAYGDFLVCEDTCPNTIREFKNARHGTKGEARADGDDHCLTALEYALEPMKPRMRRYKDYKNH